MEQKSARKIDVLANAISIAIIALYAFDWWRHGAPFAWHLLFLLALGGPPGADGFYGLRLVDMAKRGTRDYLLRFRDMTAEEATAAAHRSERDAQLARAFFVMLTELCFAMGWLSFDRPVSPSIILGFFAVLGAIFLGGTMFGVGYALWRLRS